MNPPIARRLDRLETAASEQIQPEGGKAVLDALYDQLFLGIPANFPPPSPATQRYIDQLYDQIVASQAERRRKRASSHLGYLDGVTAMFEQRFGGGQSRRLAAIFEQ
jgi:hypothetical protein